MAGNFQHMAGAGGNPMMMQAQQHQHQQQPSVQAMQQSLLHHIQQQPAHLSGWQATLTPGERFSAAWQMVTQLRLANSNLDYNRTLHMAATIERGNFENAPDKETYSKNLREKMEQLTSVRASVGPNAQAQVHSQAQAQLQNQANQAQAQAHAQAQQMNMANQAGVQGPLQRGVMGQQQPHQPFHHLQHQMQASPLPGQQQLQQHQRTLQGLSMGIGNNAVPQNISNQQLRQLQQPFQMGIQPQQMVAEGRQQLGMNNFTTQENGMINALAQRMMQNTSEEERNIVRQNLRSKMDPAQLMRYTASNMDPALLYYRSQAMNRFQQNRQRQLQQSQSIQQNINAPSAAPMQQQRSANAGVGNTQAQQALQMPPTQEFGTFVGGGENLLSQQQRHDMAAQDMNQLGISTNGQQGSSNPQGLQGLGGPQSGLNGQRPQSNPNLRAQQASQAFNNQQSQTDRINNTTQSQAQLRANATAQAKVAQQMALHGQPGGMGPMPPQQSPAMTTLNAPLRTPQQSQQPNPVDPLQMMQPNTAHFGQPIDPRFAQSNQQRGGGLSLNGQPAPPNLTQDQQKLLTLPKEKLNEVLGKWSGKPQSAMPLNVQGVRPNQPSSQGPPFTQQGMGNQFMNNGQNAQQQAQMMASMTPQSMILRQQQIAAARIAQQQGRPPTMPPNMMQLDDQTVNQMDRLEVPPSVLNAAPFFRSAPPEAKTWGEIKKWVSQNPMASQSNLVETVNNFQRFHFAQIIRSKAAAAQRMQAPGQTNGPTTAQSVPAPVVAAGMAPIAPMSINQLQMPNGDMNNLGGQIITQEDIQKLRAQQNSKWATMNDDQIRQIILRNTYLAQSHQAEQSRQLQVAQKAQLAQSQPQHQQGNQIPVQRTPQPQPQRAQNLNQPPKQTGRGQSGQSNAPQGISQHSATPDQAVPVSTATRPAKGGQIARPNQATASLPQPPKNNLKRANSDDIVEVPNPNFQTAPRSTPQPSISQPKSVQQMRGQAPLTPQLLASLSPEQRQLYQQNLARSQSNMLRGNPADILKCNQVFQEEVAKMEPLPPIPMTADQRIATATTLKNTGSKLKRVKQALPKWFAITHDEKRLRLFCRTYQNISQQFQGGDLEKLRETFSVTADDVDKAYDLANHMMADVTKQFPNLAKTASGAATTGITATSKMPAKDLHPAQAIPLNAANLQQQQQALKQVNQAKSHNRSNSRNAPPAAPTSAHAPAFPANALPNSLTQDQLRLPQNKKQKHSATSTPLMGQNTPGSTTSQPIKPGSPDFGNQQATYPKEAERAGFFCSQLFCEHHFLDGFESEDALEKHTEEEHVKPTRNPPQFVLEELGKTLGLGHKGRSENTSDMTPQSGTVLESIVMAKSYSTPAVVGAVAMDQQLSTSGVKASTVNPRDRNSKDANGSNFQSKSKGIESASEVAIMEADLWINAPVNAEDVPHNFHGLETGAGGAISDMNVFRSITPNDTPESSKDGISEPTSDISEGFDLSISLDFNFPFGPGDADDLLGLSKISVNPDEHMGGIFEDETDQVVQWNDFMDQSMFDKPFAFDTGMFSMNAE